MKGWLAEHTLLPLIDVAHPYLAFEEFLFRQLAPSDNRSLVEFLVVNPRT